MAKKYGTMEKLWYYENNDGTIVNYSLLLYFFVRETLQ